MIPTFLPDVYIYSELFIWKKMFYKGLFHFPEFFKIAFIYKRGARKNESSRGTIMSKIFQHMNVWSATLHLA